MPSGNDCIHVLVRSAGLKMPLAQAHPFEPMPITHEEEMQEVSEGELKGSARLICCLSSSRAVTSAPLPLVSQLKGSENVRPSVLYGHKNLVRRFVCNLMFAYCPIALIYRICIALSCKCQSEYASEES